MDYLSLSAAEYFTAVTPGWVHDYNAYLGLWTKNSILPGSLYSLFPLQTVRINEPFKRCKQK